MCKCGFNTDPAFNCCLLFIELRLRISNLLLHHFITFRRHCKFSVHNNSIIQKRIAKQTYTRAHSHTKNLFRFFICLLKYLGSWDSSVGIVTGWTARVRFPAVKDFSLLHSVQTEPGAHPAPYPMCTGAYFPGVKRPGRKADHSPRLIKLELYLHSPNCFHGIVLN
jgi:hypothetical protein